VIAVANFGSRSISLYTISDAAALVRLTPASALPGDLVVVQTDGVSLPGGTTVEVDGMTATPVHTAGGALAFRVPALVQGDASVALASTDGRTLSLPLRVVDRIDAHTAAPTGLVLGPDPAACTGGAAGAMQVMRVSPDGNLLAVNRTGAACALLDVYRVDPAGGPFGERLIDGLSLGALSGVQDIAFTPDSRKVWLTGPGGELVEVVVDTGDPAFGSVLAFGAGEVGTGLALTTDPFGRYLIVAAEPSPGATELQLWTPGRTRVQSTPVPGSVHALAASPDGRWVVAGGDGAAYVMDLDAPASLIVTPSHGATAFVNAVAVTGDGKRAVGVFQGDQIAIWNLDAGAGPVGGELYFGAPLPPGTSAGQLAPAPDGDGILAGCPNCASLLKIETATLPPTVLQATLAEPARSIARSADGRRLFAANWTDATLAGTVRVVNLNGAATRLTVTSGLDQTAQGGQVLPQPVTVQVTDAVGKPQAGVLVAFALADAAQGSLDGAPGQTTARSISDLNGQASVSWTMPLTPATVDMQISVLGTGIPPRTLTAESVLDDAVAAPMVLAIGPANGSTGIRAGTTVYARFSQRMDVTTLGLQLTANGGGVLGLVSSAEEGRVVYFRPAQPIPFGATCVFTVPPGAVDLEGQVLATGGSTQFTIETLPVLSIRTASPPAAAAGAEVTLIGDGFSTVAAQNVVRFGGVQATVLRSAATSIVALIPPSVPTGASNVTVGVGAIVSPTLAFTVLSPNPTPLQTIEDVSAHTGIQDLAISPDGNRVYVTSPTTNSVLAFQLHPSLFLASIPVGLKPQSIAFLPNGSKAYVANTAGNNISVIDTDPASPTYNRVLETGATRPPVYPIRVGSKPVDVSVSPFGPTVVVLNSGDGTLSLIGADPLDGGSDAVTSSVNLGSGGQDIAITPDGTRAYVATATGVVEVSLISKAVTSSLNLGSGGQGIAVTPDGTVLFVITEHDSLFVVNITPGSSSYNRVTSSVNLGSGGQSVAVTPDGALLYVALRDVNAVEVFRIIRSGSGGGGGVTTIPGAAVSLSQVASLSVGVSPAKVFADPRGKVVLVANEGSGTLTILGTPAVSTIAAVVPATTCISPSHPCVDVPVVFARVDATPVRAFSVRVRLSAELVACGAQFVQGTYLTSSGGETFFHVLDNQDGTYDVDEAILGVPCGVTGDGTLFTLQLGSAAPSATGTITIENVLVRDCDNQPVSGEPGPGASVPIQNTGPAAPTQLSAQRLTSGNDGDGTMKITIAYTASVGPGGRVEVWRKPFGNYPRYDDGVTPGSVPVMPASYPPAGWTLTAVTASGQQDDPPARDFWYYVAYAIDACDNATASALTGGTLNYLLGDVTNGSAECTGDNAVATADVSLLGGHYGETLVGSEAWICLDVGPTEGGSVNGRPLTDAILQFEDLVMFALDFGASSAPPGAAHAIRATAETDALALKAPSQVTAGETFEVEVLMRGAGGVQALSTALTWNAAVVEPLGVTAGAMLESQGGVLFSPGHGRIDAALLGAHRQGLAGEGALAVWTFRALADGDPGVVLGAVDARDASNHRITLGESSPRPDVPTSTSFDRVSPNPFTTTATMAFSLAVESRVMLSIYSVDGRRVRALAGGIYPAGIHQLAWDGVDARGGRVRPGLYFARLEAGGKTFTRTLVLMR
jgi:DNA-binding beta-propeller fold protein YncE